MEKIVIIKDVLYIKPLKKPLNQKEIKKFKKILDNEIKSLKHHFNNEAAWDIDFNYYYEEALMQFLGLNIDLKFEALSYALNKIKGISAYYKEGTFKLTNEKEKVFYNPLNDKIYLSKTAKNVEYDIQLGDF